MPRVLLISDLHLSGERPAISRKFFEFLERRAAGAVALYVLGDLFEYWIGDDELDEGPGADPLAREVAEALRRLADRGVAVRVMRGNRDFLLGERFCRAAGAQLVEDPSLAELDAVPTLLVHGDTLCVDDRDYQAWRRTCRSPEWISAFLARPLPERREAVLGLRERSREVIAEKPAAIMDVSPDAVRAAFREHGVARLIHGHTHRPGCEALEVDGRRCERWVLPDWYERGGYLELERGAARLVPL